MPDRTLRRHDLAAGRRGDRIVIGRAGVGASPLFIDVDDARWLALVALPALSLAPELNVAPSRAPRGHDDDAELATPIEEPSAALAPSAPAVPALF
jgi:hypothetical protein